MAKDLQHFRRLGHDCGRSQFSPWCSDSLCRYSRSTRVPTGGCCSGRVTRSSTRCLCARSFRCGRPSILWTATNEFLMISRVCSEGKESTTVYEHKARPTLFSFSCHPTCQCFCGPQERIFVVHGGLFPHDGVTLNHIRGMSRKREPPIHGNSFEDQVRVHKVALEPRWPLSKSDREQGG